MFSAAWAVVVASVIVSCLGCGAGGSLGAALSSPSHGDQEGESTLRVDVDGDGVGDLVLLQEKKQSALLVILPSSSWPQIWSRTYALNAAMAEGGFCGGHVDLSIEPNDERSAFRGRILRLADGMCDSFFVRWDEGRRTLISERAPLE